MASDKAETWAYWRLEDQLNDLWFTQIFSSYSGLNRPCDLLCVHGHGQAFCQFSKQWVEAEDYRIIPERRIKANLLMDVTRSSFCSGIIRSTGKIYGDLKIIENGFSDWYLLLYVIMSSNKLHIFHLALCLTVFLGL